MAKQARPQEVTVEPEADEAEVEDTAEAGPAFDPSAMIADAAETIAAEARAHPYRTVGIAFAVGYVLGGGVPRFAVRMATTAALRTLGRAVLTSDAVAELVRGAVSSRAAAPTKRAAPVKNGARKRR